MAHLRFRSIPVRKWLVPAIAVLLAMAAPAVYGHGIAMRPRPNMMPSMMHSRMPMRTPAMTPMTTSTTNALLRRDIRLDSLLRRDLRFDRFRRDFGLSPFGTMGMFGGTVGGGFGGGVGLIPFGVGEGTSTAVVQKSPSDTQDSARAALLEEQIIAERLANRRRAFDELQYEREKTLSPAQDLLNRSRGNPPPAEVLSGQSLNALLADLRTPSFGTNSADRPNPRLPLDEQALRHINVTRSAGNVAVLKNGGRLSWPAALTGAPVQGPRDHLGALAPEVVRQAGNTGNVDPGTLRQMADDVNQLRALLRANVKELSFQSYTEARDFLQRFDDALVALGQPDVANYFNGKYALNAETVLGLVKQMSDAGLHFAPAAPGDEAVYAALQESLAACDRAIAKPQSVSR
jgi:hypothetical protein